MPDVHQGIATPWNRRKESSPFLNKVMCLHRNFVRAEPAKKLHCLRKRKPIDSFNATTYASNKTWWEMEVKVDIVKAMPETSEDRDTNLAKSILVR